MSKRYVALRSLTRCALFAVAVLACSACATSDETSSDGSDETEPDSTLDEDGDGLNTAQEKEHGTDPAVADSDSDGHSDGEEIAGNTDPLDPNDYPYAGGWAIGACRDDIIGTGYEEGDTALDFNLADQFGDQIRLHSFCDRAILLLGAAFW